MAHVSDTEIRVLHVDDEPGFVDMAAEHLERENDRFSVRTATSATEGMEYLEDSNIDCVVSDYDMPGMDGLEFLEVVREEIGDIPFILYTGKGSEEVASEAIAAGVTNYLQKRSGTDQYTLLANRIENAVEQTRATQQAAAEHRINRVVRKVDEALVQATSETEIDEQVCEILSGADPYRYAWIGEPDPETGRVVPRAEGGVETTYLDDVEITAEQKPTGLGPTGKALRTGELSVMQNLPENPEFEPWRERALEHGFKSSAAIPLEYEDTQYGVLNIYAHRTGAFDKPERRLLSNLGETIGHAYHRVTLQEKFADQYRTFFEEAPVMVASTKATPDGPIIEDCNVEFADRLGYSREEIRGTRLAEYYTESSAEKLLSKNRYQQALEGEFTREQRRLRTRNGEELLTILRAAPRRDTAGEIIGTHALYLDITDEQHVQDLQRKNVLLSTLFDTLPEGILAEDESRNVLEINQKLLDMFDFAESATALIGADCERLAKDVSGQFEEPEQFVGRINNVISSGKGVDGEQLALADGRTLERSYRPLQLPDAQGHLWVYREITERMERQKELETVLERMNDAVFIHRDDGQFIFVNQRAVDRYGYAEQEVLNMRPGDLEGAETETPVSEQVEQIKAQGELVFERELQTASGAIVPVEVSSSLISFRGDPAVLSIVRDITDRKERERELRRQNERLDEFASVVSHDLRNPLNVAHGRIDLAREEFESDHLDAAADGIQRSLSLIDDMLALARAGTQTAEMESVDLSSLVDITWNHVETGQADLNADIDLQVRADRSRLRQLFENLFRNAVEHGGNTVTVTVGPLPDGFYVEDDGTGILADFQDEIFEAGFSSDADGIGFGLPIVKQIVEAHEWDIQAQEGADGGARFEITGVDVTPKAAGS